MRSYHMLLLLTLPPLVVQHNENLRSYEEVNLQSRVTPVSTAHSTVDIKIKNMSMLANNRELEAVVMKNRQSQSDF